MSGFALQAVVSRAIEETPRLSTSYC